jgi:peptide/histidine transporter 3/4
MEAEIIGGNHGWIPDHLNEGHLDYFFCLLAGLNFMDFVVYILCANKFKSKKAA